MAGVMVALIEVPFRENVEESVLSDTWWNGARILPQVSDTGQASGTQPAGGWGVQGVIDQYRMLKNPFGAGSQLIEQRARILQVRRAKSFGEPAVDFGQQLAGCVWLALRLPQSRQAGRRPQLQRLHFLRAGNC